MGWLAQFDWFSQNPAFFLGVFTHKKYLKHSSATLAPSERLESLKQSDRVDVDWVYFCKNDFTEHTRWTSSHQDVVRLIQLLILLFNPTHLCMEKFIIYCVSLSVSSSGNCVTKILHTSTASSAPCIIYLEKNSKNTSRSLEENFQGILVL